MKKSIVSVLITSAVLCSFAGCGDGAENKAETIVETTAGMTFETTSQTESGTLSEDDLLARLQQDVESVVAQQTEAENDDTEKVIISGQEFPVDAEIVDIYIEYAEPVIDISELSRFTNLKTLNIIGFNSDGLPEVMGFEVLNGCETLEEINFMADFAHEEDVFVLNTMPNLKKLKLTHLNLYNCWDFGAVGLEYANFSGTFGLDKLEQMTKLEKLYLNDNESTDLAPIKNLNSLSVIQIDNCGFTDLSPLLDITDIRYINFKNMEVSAEMRDKLAAELPDADISITD